MLPLAKLTKVVSMRHIFSISLLPILATTLLVLADGAVTLPMLARAVERWATESEQ